MRKQLKSDAVPSLFAWTTENKYVKGRTERLLRRRAAAAATCTSSSVPEVTPLVSAVTVNDDIGAEETVKDSSDETNIAVDDNTEDVTPTYISSSTQTVEEPPFSIN